MVRQANCSQVSSQDGPGAAIDTACLDMVLELSSVSVTVSGGLYQQSMRPSVNQP